MHNKLFCQKCFEAFMKELEINDYKEFLLCCSEKHVPRRMKNLVYKARTMPVNVEAMSVENKKILQECQGPVF